MYLIYFHKITLIVSPRSVNVYIYIYQWIYLRREFYLSKVDPPFQTWFLRARTLAPYYYSIITRREREGCVINNFLFPKEILEIHTLAFDIDVNMDGFNPMVIKSEIIPGIHRIFTGEISKPVSLYNISHRRKFINIHMQYIYIQ